MKTKITTILLLTSSLMACGGSSGAENPGKTILPNLTSSAEVPSPDQPEEPITGECKGVGTWRSISNIDSPSERYNPGSTWTKSGFFIFGGVNIDDGAIFDPTSNTWLALPNTGAPSARSEESVIQIGTKTIVWGGYTPDGAVNDGAIYDSSTSAWTPMNNLGAPSGRYDHAAVAISNSKMIVWGGFGDNGYKNDGAIYDLIANTWTPISNVNAPSAREIRSSAVWTGQSMIVWGGLANSTALGTGAMYNPQNNTWITISTINAPIARFDHTTIWTGKEMIVWGGGNTAYYQPFVHLGDGAKFDPLKNTWTPISNVNAPAARIFHNAVWTGRTMLIYGGSGSTGYFNDASTYDASSDTWIGSCAIGALSPRHKSSAVWTGTQMIIWGGDNGIDGFTNGATITP